MIVTSLIVIVCFALCCIFWSDGSFFVGLTFFVAAVFFGYMTYNESLPETKLKAQLKAQEIKKQELADLQPRPIRYVDNCTVYAFKDMGRWHYFTKCPGSQVTTDAQSEDCRMVGKHQKCETKTETITTR